MASSEIVLLANTSKAPETVPVVDDRLAVAAPMTVLKTTAPPAASDVPDPSRELPPEDEIPRSPMAVTVVFSSARSVISPAEIVTIVSSTSATASVRTSLRTNIPPKPVLLEEVKFRPVGTISVASSARQRDLSVKSSLAMSIDSAPALVSTMNL